jgi:arylsulfatase A-like enzyme
MPSIADHPNIILILTDQQRWDAMGAYGNRVIQTPNMDRLASQGAVFERAYAAHPMCAPTRAAMMSGYPAAHPAHHEHSRILHPDRTVPARLGQAGYRTQGIGKFHFVPEWKRTVIGFDDVLFSEEMRWLAFAPSSEDVDFDDYDRYLLRHGLFGWQKPQEIGFNEMKPLVNHLPREHHVTQWCGDRTVEWLQSAAGTEQPYLLWCSFVKPHVPYDAPEHLKDLYNPADMPPPWRRDGELDQWTFYRDLHHQRELDLYSRAARDRGLAYYYANITFIDEQIGRILDTVEASGQADNTIIIFSSDHGDLMGDHDQWFKQLGYEGSTHVPLLVRAPGRIPPGTRVDTPVSHLDIPQTILELGGATNTNEDRFGLNLLDLATGRKTRDAVVSQYNRGYGFYYCHRRWKYHFYPNGGYEELFDMHNDPRELNNLAADRDYEGMKQQSRAELIQWLKQYNAGSGLDEKGNLIVTPYNPPRDGELPRPYGRLPWESRVPPAVLQARGEKVHWWWQKHGMDMRAFLKDEVRGSELK